MYYFKRMFNDNDPLRNQGERGSGQNDSFEKSQSSQDESTLQLHSFDLILRKESKLEDIYIDEFTDLPEDEAQTSKVTGQESDVTE